MKKLKWTSVSEYVDLETGEKLTKEIATAHYRITNKRIIKKFNNEKSSGITYITNECRRTGQTTLF